MAQELQKIELVTGETFLVARGRSIGLLSAYVFGILLGVVFVVLWLTGTAEMGLGIAGIVIAGFCGYLLPDTLKPSVAGESLVLGNDRLQFVQGTNDVVGQIFYANVKRISLNQADGHKSIWIELIDPATDGTRWPGGLDLMEIIHSQCEHHVVAGKNLSITPHLLKQMIDEKRQAK